MWLVLAPRQATRAPATGGLLLAARAMSDDERARLDGALVEVARRLDVRADPLADDFEDDPPDAELRRLLPAALPKLTAARMLSAASWSGTRFDSDVRAATTCPTGARCIDPFARGGEVEDRQARFLAWPIATAAILELPDALLRAKTVALLRARAADPDSRIALVLTTDDAAIAPSLAEHARHVAHRLRRAEGGETAAALLDDRAPARLPTWLPLGPREILVIPRLGSLATLSAFAAELDGIVPPTAWRLRPRPLD